MWSSKFVLEVTSFPPLQTDHGLQALQEIRAVLLEGDVSSFEVIHSGLVSRLLSFLTMANCHRDDRLRTFLQVFLHTPQVGASGKLLGTPGRVWRRLKCRPFACRVLEDPLVGGTLRALQLCNE